jgi:hypothetical protein
MSIFVSTRLEERAEGIRQLADCLSDKSRVFIIHYSCESFFNIHGRSPRITSISVRNIQSGQTLSFSIHLHAQINKKDFNNLGVLEYDKLELEMLKEFYAFAEKRKAYKWIHWNMRDSNFGFEAISNRFRILGGNPLEIEVEKRFDLPRLLGKIYTYEYEGHGANGRLLSLANRNNISSKDALNGANEAIAFEERNYLALHKSTLKKIDIIETVIEKAYNNILKVKPGDIDIYGLSISGVRELIMNNWLLSTVSSLIIFIAGCLVQKYFFS